ncbi:MAG: DUF1684 domain-containing protein [Actinomycetaceae bacterium]|nr:DUF1684 domain-containing protein [Actinomycetaceae bacterium]
MVNDRTADAWAAWHAEREDALTTEYGWLTLTSLTHIEAEPTSLPDFPGQWRTLHADNEGARVAIIFAEGDEVTQDGTEVPTDTEITIDLPQGESDQSLQWHASRAEVAHRGAGVIVRVRNPHAQARQEFDGIPTWDFDERWICPATAVWDDEPTTITVPSAQEGLTSRLTRLGTLNVTLPGDQHAELVITDAHGEPAVIFHDPTNGVSSPGWRIAPVISSDSEDSDEGGVYVDFTRSQIFPAHLTPYGTCPTPPVGNTVPIDVPAGEKAREMRSA